MEDWEVFPKREDSMHDLPGTLGRGGELSALSDLLEGKAKPWAELVGLSDREGFRAAVGGVWLTTARQAEGENKKQPAGASTQERREE